MTVEEMNNLLCFFGDVMSLCVKDFSCIYHSAIHSEKMRNGGVLKHMKVTLSRREMCVSSF